MAAINVQVKIKNAAEIQRIFKRLAPKEVTKAQKKGAQEAAGHLQKQIRMAAPTGPRDWRQGASEQYKPLKKNIKKVTFRVKNNIVEAGVHSGDAFWWRFVEYGHDIKFTRRGPVVGKAQPHPFITPTVKREAQNAMAFFVEGIKKAIYKMRSK